MRSLLLRFWKQRQNRIMSDRHRGSSYFRATGKTLLDSSCTQSTIAFKIWNMLLFWLYDYNITGGYKGSKQTKYHLLAQKPLPKRDACKTCKNRTPPPEAPVFKKNPNFGAEMSLMDWSVLRRKAFVCVWGHFGLKAQSSFATFFLCLRFPPWSKLL